MPRVEAEPVAGDATGYTVWPCSKEVSHREGHQTHVWGATQDGQQGACRNAPQAIPGPLDVSQELTEYQGILVAYPVAWCSHILVLWSKLMEPELVHKHSMLQWGGFLSDLHSSQSHDLGNCMGERWGAISNVGRWEKKTEVHSHLLLLTLTFPGTMHGLTGL